MSILQFQGKQPKIDPNTQPDELDISQYEVKSLKDSVSSNPSSQQDDLDLSKYEVVGTGRKIANKAGRMAGQLAIAGAEAVTMPYNIVATGANLIANAGSEKVQKRAKAELKYLEGKKAAGTLTAREEKYFDRIKHIAEHGPNQMPALDVGSLLEKGAEKAFGVDLRPQGIAEHGVRFAGMIKNPGKLLQVGKLALGAVKDPKKLLQLTKAFTPGTKELSRGFGAAVGLEAAKEGHFGPIPTIGATVVGDLVGGGIQGGIKGLSRAVKNPKQTAATGIAKMAKKSELDLRKQLIKDFRDAGVEADVGTLTGSGFLQGLQAKLAASSLTGKPLEELRKRITDQVNKEYKAVADGIGELKHTSDFEVGEAVQNLGRKIRDEQKATNRGLYEAAEGSLPENARINSAPLLNAIQKVELKLKPGALKSKEQTAVLDALKKIKTDLLDANGVPVANVKSISNMKKALNDIVDFDVQGGQKQILKGIGKEMDKLLEAYGAVNRDYGTKFRAAQKAHGEHAKTFRDNAVEKLLEQGSKPELIMQRMNNIGEIRQIEKALSTTPEGKELFNQLKRYKLEEMVGDKIVDSVTNQLKHGTFAKILEKGQKEPVVRELLGEQQFARLQRVQKTSGKLAESLQKFLNTSQTATSKIDYGIYATLGASAIPALGLNFWPLIKVGGSLLAAKQFSKMISDPEFLKLVEEAILARNNPVRLKGIWPQIAEKAKELGIQEIRPAAEAAKESQQRDQAS